MSRNVAFNENDKPRELEDFAKIPSLQAEGEQASQKPDLQIPALQTKQETKIMTAKIIEIPMDMPETLAEQELPRLQSRMTPIDYRKLDNPKSRLPSLQSTSQSPVPSQNITRLMESSKAKNRSQEQVNFALESLYKDILEYSFNASNTNDPKTVEEALGGSDAKQWKEAIETEMETISKMGVWDLEELPKD